MKTLKILGITLIAIFAFGVITAASASAETAFWLAGGNAITALTSTASAGLLLLSFKIGVERTTVHCDVEFFGSVGANGEDEVNEMLSSEGNKTGVPLTGTAAKCQVSTGGLCTFGATGEVWPTELPWHTHLLLLAAPEPEYLDIYLAETGKLPGFEVKCPGPLGTFSVECKGMTSSSLQNTGGPTLLESFGPGAKSENMPCTIGEGLIEGEMLVALLNAATLTVSMTLP